jgi:signal transduction histidine kinase
VPLLLLSIVSFRHQTQTTDDLLGANLEDELANASSNFANLVGARKHELMALAESPVRDWVLVASGRKPDVSSSAYQLSSLPAAEAGSPGSYVSSDVVSKTKTAVGALLIYQRYYASISGYDSARRLLFVAEPEPGKPEGVNFRTTNFLPSQTLIDEQIWKSVDRTPRCVVIVNESNGATLRCSAPLQTAQTPASERGVLVAILKLDSLVSEAAGSWDSHSTSDATTGAQSSSRIVTVLDTSGRIVYHTNDALKYQPVSTALPSFTTIAGAMMSGQRGSGIFTSTNGDKWLAAYGPLGANGLSLAVASNYSLTAHGARVGGWLGIGLSLFIGFAIALLLTFYYQRKTQSLELVTQSVAAIAGGKLDQELLLRSSDEMRLLADSVNVMTEKMREQIAREAEARQFESFVKLSALLTHDLKNAIEGLSLMVSNMERHFDNPKFRADAMRALTGAADKLRGLVARLSNPVNTLSGEFKMPRPTDLVPLLRRVLAQLADPLRDTLEIEARLPLSLMAMADSERIEKVMENLVLNAVEAMDRKSGKLTVEAGTLDGAKVFFQVSDTGVGMSPGFIKQRLFHPFATTKSRGVGLGLYTCREVVRANGGTIAVESKEGSGTTFRVVLASAQHQKARLEV